MPLRTNAGAYSRQPPLRRRRAKPRRWCVPTDEPRQRWSIRLPRPGLTRSIRRSAFRCPLPQLARRLSRSMGLGLTPDHALQACRPSSTRNSRIRLDICAGVSGLNPVRACAWQCRPVRPPLPVSAAVRAGGMNPLTEFDKMASSVRSLDIFITSDLRLDRFDLVISSFMTIYSRFDHCFNPYFWRVDMVNVEFSSFMAILYPFNEQARSAGAPAVGRRPAA